MGRRRHHSKGGNKQQGVQDTSTDQNQSLNKSSTLQSNNVSNGNEKSAFEVLKAAKLQQNESIVNGKGPLSTSTPLASDFRRKQRANDGSGAARVPIGTKPQPQKSVTEKKEKPDKEKNGKTDSTTAGVVGTEKKSSDGESMERPVKEGSAKKHKKKGLKRNAEGLSPAPESKHPRNEEDNSSKANDKNVFVDLINSTNKTEVELKGKKKKKKHSVAKETAHVVHKKVVSGGKIVELDENEENDGGATDDHSKGDDALIVDNLVSLDEPEKEGGDEDQEVSSDEDEEVDDEMTSDSSDMTTLDSEDWKSEDMEKEKKRKAIAMLKEPKDFKPEDYRVVLKCDKQMAKGQLKGGTVVNFDELPFSKHADSVQNAIDAWQWIIAPMKVDEFFDNIFENKTLVVHRKNPQYYGNLYSTKKFVKILQEHYLEYGTHVNAAVYVDGERYTPNGIGKVYPNEIRAHLNAGHSIQFVNPQTYCNSVWHLCDTIQEMFGSFVGANTYLTPAGTAGFAPHWDEIDAFLMQVEGRKHWKVFAPVGKDDALPRDSSGNFSDSDLAGRTPVFDGWIEQGDLIYIPRGFIHQGYTDASTHSLHLTVSVCRRDAFVDLLEKFLPVAISSLADETLSMRRSMPTRYMDMCGVLPLKYALEKKAKPKILSVLEKQLDALKQGVSDAYESAIDMMAREYLKTAIPPLLTKEERELSVTGGEDFDILNKKETKFTTKTKVKFIRRHAQRLIFESEDRCYVVHRMTNSRIYEGRPEVTFGLDADLSDGFASLLETYPDWCSVGSIECETDEQRIQLAKVLYGNGLLMAKF